MVTQMLALFCCDHALSITVYNHVATMANMIQSTTHLIVVVMAFDLLLSEIKFLALQSDQTFQCSFTSSITTENLTNGQAVNDPVIELMG